MEKRWADHAGWAMIYAMLGYVGRLVNPFGLGLLLATMTESVTTAWPTCIALPLPSVKGRYAYLKQRAQGSAALAQ